MTIGIKGTVRGPRGLDSDPRPSPNLRLLRYVAILGPVGFAIGVGVFNKLVLEQILPGYLAAVAATLIVAGGAIVFAGWIFRLLSRIQEQRAHMARLEERERIASKLHDEVIQSIYAIQLKLQACLHQLQRLSSDADEDINQALEDLNDVSIRVRRHIFDLKLNVAGPSDLVRALEHLVEDVRVNSLIAAELEIKGPVSHHLTEEQAHGLFLVTQEALANAARHARATFIRCRLADIAGTIQLEVSDNGIGFDHQSTAGNGLGKMNEWARSLGGRLLVDGADGGGTRIQLTFPSARTSRPRLEGI